MDKNKFIKGMKQVYGLCVLKPRVISSRVLQRVSVECRKTKTKLITLPIKKDGDNPVNQSKLEVITHVADTKRRKMCTREPRLVLVSLLIG